MRLHNDTLEFHCDVTPDTPLFRYKLQIEVFHEIVRPVLIGFFLFTLKLFKMWIFVACYSMYNKNEL